MVPDQEMKADTEPGRLPLFVDFTGLHCLVIGAGTVGTRKVERLLAAGASVTVVGNEVSARLDALAKDARIHLERRPFRDTDLNDKGGHRWALVVAATDNESLNIAIANACKAEGILVNVASPGSASSTIIPAVIARGPLQVSVHTGGASPALAKHLHQLLERLVPKSYGVLAQLLKDIRDDVKRTLPSQEIRQRFFENVLNSNIWSLLEADRNVEASTYLRNLLDQDQANLQQHTSVPEIEAAPLHFSPVEREHFYNVVAARRDMRHFAKSDPVHPDVLARILSAALQAPSVGLMQPWRYIHIENPSLREAIASIVETERIKTAEVMGERRDEFLRLKVEGVRECANLFVLATAPDDGTVFGRRTLPYETALSSVACSMQNFWLAARAENLGVGCVSLFDPLTLAKLFNMPTGSKAIAILCLGPVDSFYSRPMLELDQWREAKPFAELFFVDGWGS